MSMTAAELLAALAPLADDADYVSLDVLPKSIKVHFTMPKDVAAVDAACALLDVTPAWSARSSQYPYPWQYSATTTYDGCTLTVLTLCTADEHAAHTGQQAVTS